MDERPGARAPKNDPAPGRDGPGPANGHGRSARHGGMTDQRTVPAGECTRMHFHHRAGMHAGCVRNVRRQQERRTCHRHSGHAFRNAPIATTKGGIEQAWNAPDVVSDRSRRGGLSAGGPGQRCRRERDAPCQRTRIGVPPNTRIPRNGVVAVIIMVRPPLGLVLTRSVLLRKTIHTDIPRASPFPELLQNCIPEHGGTPDGNTWTRQHPRCRSAPGVLRRVS